MNKHLKLVREFHHACSYPQAEHGSNQHLSDMAVIVHQSLLMEAGSAVLDALKAGEMAEILAGLVDLAYRALSAIAERGDDVTERPVAWRHDGYVLSIARLLSDKINNCTTGDTDHYSEVYALCIQLSRGFLNADFDKAFQCVHDHNLYKLDKSGVSIYGEADKIRREKLLNEPDLTECLFE